MHQPDAWWRNIMTCTAHKGCTTHIRPIPSLLHCLLHYTCLVLISPRKGAGIQALTPFLYTLKLLPS
jgi:hypothetical protein